VFLRFAGQFNHQSAFNIKFQLINLMKNKEKIPYLFGLPIFELNFTHDQIYLK